MKSTLFKTKSTDKVCVCVCMWSVFLIDQRPKFNLSEWYMAWFFIKYRDQKALVYNDSGL